MSDRKKTCASARLGAILLAAALLLAGAPAYAAGGEYSTYVNENVCFTVDYPTGYGVSEPYDNVVFISDGDDFHFSVEYAYMTLDGVAIYSAADFASMLDADGQMLAEWVGVSAVSLTDRYAMETANGLCQVFNYDCRVDGRDCMGALALFDGKGDFGCYCVSAMVNEDAAKIDTYSDQADHMLGSFSITGPYQPDDLVRYTFTEEGETVDIMVSASVAKVTQWTTGGICVYPLDHVFTEGSIIIKKTVYDAADDPQKVMEGVCSYYFTMMDEASYDSEMSSTPWGRNTIYVQPVSYIDDGTVMYTIEVILLHDGAYWEVYGSFTEENEIAVGDEMESLVGSLRLGGEPVCDVDVVSDWSGSGSSEPSGQTGGTASSGVSLSGEDAAAVPAARTWSVNEQIDEIVAATQSVTGYTESEYMEPLGSATDVDNDGVWEFLEVYETKNASTGMITVRYAAWAMQEGGPVLLASDALFTEVGGNGGYVGIAVRDGANYLVVATDSPDGDGFHKTWRYIPWQGAALGSGAVEMTADGSYVVAGGSYTVDGASVSQSDLEAAQGQFTEMFHLDIVEGHGNGTVMALADADQWNFDI